MEVAAFEYKGFTSLQSGQAVAEGKEREEYDAIKGFSPIQRISTYLSYIHDRNINSHDDEEDIANSVATIFTKSAPVIANFFIEQQNITSDNYHFIKDDSISKTRKVLSYLGGSTLSAVSETIFQLAFLVKNVFLTIWDSTAGLVWECLKFGYDLILDENTAEFSQRFSQIKEHGSKSLSNINQIVRNVFRVVPGVGHFLGQGFDVIETSILDGAERVAQNVKQLCSCLGKSKK